MQGPATTGTWKVTRLHPKKAGNRLLPAPSGPNTIGRMAFDWTDDTRPELETLDPHDHRRIMVHLFYPAQRRDQAETTSYLPDVDELRGEWSERQIVATCLVKTRNSDRKQDCAARAGDCKLQQWSRCIGILRAW